MPKSKAQAICEQVAHFTLLGVGLTVLSPFVSIPVLIIREFTDWRLPWVFKGQWPPGEPYEELFVSIHHKEMQHEMMTQLASVDDLRLDVVVTLAGILVGLPLHAWWLVRVFL